MRDPFSFKLEEPEFFPNNPVLCPLTPNGVLTSSNIYSNEAVLRAYFSYRQLKEQTNGFKFTGYFAVDKKKKKKVFRDNYHKLQKNRK